MPQFVQKVFRLRLLLSRLARIVEAAEAEVGLTYYIENLPGLPKKGQNNVRCGPSMQIPK